MERESLKLLLDEGLSLEQIGRRFGKHPSTISYWLKQYGLEATNRERHLPRGGIERERLEPMIESGMTIAEIASALGRSKSTVRYWMRRHGLHARNRVGPRSDNDSRAAKDAGRLNVRFVCKHHGATDFVLEGRGYYRCKQCRARSVAQHRRKVKSILVQEAGGRCRICGYDTCIGALEFHHIDPTEKLMDVSRHGVTLSLADARQEARKCVLLCSNCHVEVEAGVTDIPAKVLAEFEHWHDAP